MEMDIGSGNRGNPDGAATASHASYGKACTNCVRSKTRCAGSSSEGKCERCHRLNKDCQPAPAVRKKRAPNRSILGTSKTAALEQKLDGIVQMLQRSQGSLESESRQFLAPTSDRWSQPVERGIEQDAPTPLPSASISAPKTSNPLDTIQNTNFDPLAFRTQMQMFGTSGTKGHVDSGRTGNGPNFFTHLDEPTPPAEVPHHDPSGFTNPHLPAREPGEHMNHLDALLTAAAERAAYRSVPSDPNAAATSDSTFACASTRAAYGATTTAAPYASTAQPPQDEAELQQCLDTYRTKMVPYFPIVCIPESTTVQELQLQRPFLWLVIRTICNRDPSRQKALEVQVRKTIGFHMLLEGTKSLDLFLGLLVFAAWGHFYIMSKPIISTVIQLSMSAAFDLSLTKPLPLIPPNCMLNYSAQGCPRPPHLAAVLTRTMEERRAVVGLFLVSSVVSNYFQRVEPLRWTPYLEDCLRQLERIQEFPTDKLLSYLARVQLINNQVFLAPWNDGINVTGAKVPSEFYSGILAAQLKELEQSIPPDLQSNIILQLHILNTNLGIHEHNLSTATNPSENTALDPIVQLNRVKHILTCFATTKLWFSKLLDLSSFPPTSFCHVSMSIMTQMSHFLVALFRLGTFEHPNVPWDRKLVWEELDLGETVTVLAERWETVFESRSTSRLNPDGSGYDPWAIGKRRMLAIAHWWQLKVVAMKAADAEKDGSEQMINGDLRNPALQIDGIDMGAMNVDFWDDVWMTDFLVGGNEFTNGSNMGYPDEAMGWDRTSQ